MNSIRRKLFLQIGALMVLFIVVLYLTNTFFLETFYVMNMKNDLEDLYMDINGLNENQYSTDLFYQLSVEGQSKVEIIMMNAESEIIFTSQNPNLRDRPEDDLENPNPPRERNFLGPHMEVLKTEVVDERSKYTWYYDKNVKVKFLAHESTLENGNEVLITLPLAAIQENVKIINQYILIIGVFILILSMVAANYISKYFTDPILDIFKVTNSISRMDFSNTCEVLTNDEIGQLGNNINKMKDSLKKNIDQLAESNAELQAEVKERLRIDEQRKTLLNNVSHELKTPISLVQGYSEGIKLNLHKNKEKTDFYCDVIMDEAKKMDLLVSQLLDINRMQFGDFPLYKEEINGKEFILSTVGKYNRIFEEENILLQSNIEEIDESLTLNIDLLRAEQVITNLLNNAIAYVDDRKEMNIMISNVIEDQGEKHIRLTVRNSFPKLDAEELSKLWNSFYKVDKARTRENGGYGLGLSIIKAIQEADHNPYGVSQDDTGISFWAEFDVKK